MTTWTFSSTLCTLPSTLCVILRISASAIRASSCVKLSSLLLVVQWRFKRPIGNSLVVPRLSSFVVIPKILSTSTMISVMMSEEDAALEGGSSDCGEIEDGLPVRVHRRRYDDRRAGLD